MNLSHTMLGRVSVIGAPDPAPLTADQVAERRVQAARRNAAYWREVDEDALVRRGHWLIDAADDAMYSEYRGHVFGSDGQIAFDPARPLVFYVTRDGTVVLLEKGPETWSDYVYRRGRAAGAR